MDLEKSFKEDLRNFQNKINQELFSYLNVKYAN
jgi:hypothetical protein